MHTEASDASDLLFTSRRYSALLVVAGDEDAPGDFGGGLASSGDGFVVGLAP